MERIQEYREDTVIGEDNTPDFLMDYHFYGAFYDDDWSYESATGKQGSFGRVPGIPGGGTAITSTNEKELW